MLLLRRRGKPLISFYNLVFYFLGEQQANTVEVSDRVLVSIHLGFFITMLS